MKYYSISLSESIKVNCIANDKLSLKKNDLCIIQYKQFKDYGRVRYVSELTDDIDRSKCYPILHHASLSDQSKANENNIRAKSMLTTAKEAVKKHHLPMNLISSHLSFDQGLIILVFTAPGRVDFRDLLRDLNKRIKPRIEFRQIGPRDQAAIIGGIGSCGRQLCCSSFLTNFVSINVKMAKIQGLSLTPSNIMGACGRLKCCLSFEYDGYKKIISEMPAIGAKCKCNGCDGKVVAKNLMTKTVKVKLDNEDKLEHVHVSEIEY